MQYARRMGLSASRGQSDQPTVSHARRSCLVTSPHTAGIYAIVNLTNGHRYVGQAMDIQQRWYQHQSDLRRGRHHSPHLQAAWRRYGPESFQLVILEATTELTIREQFWIDQLAPEYNLAPAAGSLAGYRHSEQARAHMATAQLGRHHSLETRAKMSAAAMGNQRPLGHRHSTDSRTRMSIAQTGRVHSPETRAKIAAARRGQRPSLETRAKMSAAAIGKKLSVEARAKISAAAAGNQRTLGLRHSDESKAKMSAAATARWRARRGWSVGHTHRRV